MTSYTVPTGQVDARVRVSMDETGPVPILRIEMMRRSPSEIGEDAFHPTHEPPSVQRQFVPVLMERTRQVVEESLAVRAVAAALPGAVSGQEA